MDIVWEDPPVPEGPFFTRDVYETCSVALTVPELWAFLQSRDETATEENISVADANGGCPPSNEAQQQTNSTKEECSWDSFGSEDSCPDMEVQDSKNTKVDNVPFPEPRVPYPCASALSKTEQKTYLNYLTSQMKKKKPIPQALLNRVNEEVTQFMKYLQDVSRICADDYSVIPQGALQYSEEFFQSSLDHIKTLPKLYQIHELTSLTGGKFNPALTLTSEKQLLIMGTVDITDHKPVHVDAQLASDYQSVTSETPPAKKAKDMHASISSDNNAEKLCTSYEPHVCLTRDALVRLLDNLGPDFREQWELPLLIKIHPEKGKGKRKTVYIDSPLLKTEVTVRERSHIYHQESLKRSITMNGTRKVFHVMTELPVNEQPALDRSLVSFESDSLDFEVDLTDLETFGETSTSNKVPKIKKTKNEQDAVVKSEKTASQTKSSSKNTSSSLREEMETDPVTSAGTQMLRNEAAEQQRMNSVQESDSVAHFTGDSDDEKLIIDDASTKMTPKPKPQTPQLSDPEFCLPSQATRSRRRLRQTKAPGDQLGEILRMQTAMFNSAKPSSVPQEVSSPTTQTGPSGHSHTTLVKACVSSYLERNPNQEEETFDAPHSAAAPVENLKTKEHKKRLSQDLQAAAEDEQDYEAPKEGNLLYKLYSLDDLLLMVRSSISFTHSRKFDSNQNKYVPVNIFPKLEYQLSYGVECLSSNEACQLWTETLLHSSTVSYIAHINAHTSKVALLRRLPDNWIQSISCGFKPSKSLNILHHLLKKLIGLDEGQYLLAHKAGEPFVSILKAAHGKGRQGLYNLQQAHSYMPQPPASGAVPWIPVDPSVYLPFHRKHSRVPCTFPPEDFPQTLKVGTSQNQNCRGRPTGTKKPTKRKMKKKRAAKK